MKQKLTLTVDAHVVAQAKDYAKQQGESLSSIIERFLTVLSRNSDGIAEEESMIYGLKTDTPLTNAMAGQFSVEGVTDYEQLKKERLERKYLGAS